MNEEEYRRDRNERFSKLIQSLQEKKKDIWFIKTDTGFYTHIAVDETILCHNGLRLMAKWSRDIENLDTLCYECVRNIRYQFTNDFGNILTITSPKYDVGWRCTAIIKKQGSKKG